MQALAAADAAAAAPPPPLPHSTAPPCVQRVIIYPNYLDNRKTVAQGRRIPKELGAARGGGLGGQACEDGKVDGKRH